MNRAEGWETSRDGAGSLKGGLKRAEGGKTSREGAEGLKGDLKRGEGWTRERNGLGPKGGEGWKRDGNVAGGLHGDCGEEGLTLAELTVSDEYSDWRTKGSIDCDQNLRYMYYLLWNLLM